MLNHTAFLACCAALVVAVYPAYVSLVVQKEAHYYYMSVGLLLSIRPLNGAMSLLLLESSPSLSLDICENVFNGFI